MHSGIHLNYSTEVSLEIYSERPPGTSSGERPEISPRVFRGISPPVSPKSLPEGLTKPLPRTYLVVYPLLPLYLLLATLQEFFYDFHLKFKKHFFLKFRHCFLWKSFWSFSRTIRRTTFHLHFGDLLKFFIK